jgi:hypothetical protein
MLKQLSTFAFICVLATGCRDNGGGNSLVPIDLSPGPGDMAMKSYTSSTIAAMRQAGKKGDFSLENVVAIALTPSKASPKLFVQDGAGGDFTAIETLCSSSSMTHHCSVAATIAGIPIGHVVTIKGSYDKFPAGDEPFYVDDIVDSGNAAATIPAPLTLTVADVQRGAKSAAKWFQKATVTPTEDLVMYDWSPADLVYTGSWPGCSTAPDVFGFGMTPTSAATTAGASCSTKTMQPTGQAMSLDNEILIGTDFYKDFLVSSDCQCAGGHKVKVPSSTTTWPSGKAMTGVLIFNVQDKIGFQFFSPTEAGALTNTVDAPM